MLTLKLGLFAFCVLIEACALNVFMCMNLNVLVRIQKNGSNLDMQINLKTSKMTFTCKNTHNAWLYTKMHHSFIHNHILLYLWSIKTSLDSIWPAGTWSHKRSACSRISIRVSSELPAGWAFVGADVVSACVFLHNVLWEEAVQSLTSRLSSSLVTVITWFCGVRQLQWEEAAVKVKLHADKRILRS